MEKKIIELPFVERLNRELQRVDPIIQVVIGPRQVGKTTGVKQFLGKRESGSWTYISADGEFSHSPDWLLDHWLTVRSTNPSQHLLVIDEIQKVENWSGVIKKLWDEQMDSPTKIKLILLGSSSLAIQKGLNESLAGRFFMHYVPHWNWQESLEAYNISFENYLLFGGYPGSYQFISDRVVWLNFIKESIINAVIGKDILLPNKVKSPALFKQCFKIVTSYPAQEISYTKLLGQLQDKGNTDLVKHYLELFEGAFLIKQLFKYSSKKVLLRSSSPKILPLCPALFTASLDADLNSEERGRCFELIVGAALSRLPGHLYYWREGKHEVDYIYSYGKKLLAIEVKSGRKKQTAALQKFKEKYPASQALIVTPENYCDLISSM